MQYTLWFLASSRSSIAVQALRAALRCNNPRCACHRARGGMAHCPRHSDQVPSLSIRDGIKAVLVTCLAGCPRAEVIAVLRERGLWPRTRRR
jgi:hypothetical protein